MKRRWTEWAGGAAGLGSLGSLYAWHGGASALFLLCLAGLLVISGLLIQWLGLRSATITRRLDESVISAGDTARLRVRVEFRSFLPVPWLAVEDYYTGGSSRQVLFPGFRRSMEYVCELRGLPRGVYSFDACLLEWGGLFGWFSGSRVQRSEGSFLVLPKPLPIGDGLQLPYVRSQAVMQPWFTAEHGNGAKSPEVRAYLPADPLNRIDWKSSARRGTLHTYLPEDERDPNCLVILDRSFEGYAADSGTEEERRAKAGHSFERAVSAASGIVGGLMRSGVKSMLVYGAPAASGDSVNLGDGMGAHGDGRREAYTRLLASLSPLKLGEGPKLSSLMEDSMRRSVPGTRMIVITGTPGDQAGEAAARLAAHGMQVDFYFTSMGDDPSDMSGRQVGQSGKGSAFAAALRLSRLGVGVYAVQQDAVTRIGLVEPSSLGEGAV
ncbi:DUF58 domain-containing protein [Paenibacillus sp. SAF-054]|uniref:DUF58 domain-containing protein n=1 Tax=unclassified Paenibacillus TaxID=185978 RepID=UPI003F80641F